jgi:hypothetical protein
MLLDHILQINWQESPEKNWAGWFVQFLGDADRHLVPSAEQPISFLKAQVKYTLAPQEWKEAMARIHLQDISRLTGTVQEPQPLIDIRPLARHDKGDGNCKPLAETGEITEGSATGRDQHLYSRGTRSDDGKKKDVYRRNLSVLM